MPIAACKHEDGIAHACKYVNARNRLIPEAERLAHQRAAAANDTRPMSWTREFFAAMDELAVARGLVAGRVGVANGVGKAMAA